MTDLTLDLLKSFLRYDGDDQDSVLDLAMAAGVEWVERITGHLLTQREVTQGVDAFSGPIALNYWPITADSVSIAYVDTSGASQVIADARLMNVLRPASVYPALATRWPVAASAIAVTYTAGYANPDDVPAGLLHAVQVYAGMADVDRNEGGSDTAWNALHALVGPYREAGLA